MTVTEIHKAIDAGIRIQSGTRAYFARDRKTRLLYIVEPPATRHPLDMQCHWRASREEIEAANHPIDHDAHRAGDAEEPCGGGC